MIGFESNWVYSTIRDVDKTLVLSAEAIAISTKYSFEVTLAWATSLHGWALAEKGRDEGLDLLVNGLSAAQAAGVRLNNAFTLAMLAEVYLRKKRIDEGLAALSAAQKLVRVEGERCWLAELLRLEGELLLEQPEPSVSEAEQCFAEAVKIAREQHATMFELRAAMSMARLLKKLNRSDAARSVLQAVCSKITERASNHELIEAEAILSELDG